MNVKLVGHEIKFSKADLASSNFMTLHSQALLNGDCYVSAAADTDLETVTLTSFVDRYYRHLFNRNPFVLDHVTNHRGNIVIRAAATKGLMTYTVYTLENESGDVLDCSAVYSSQQYKDMYL